MTFPRRGSASGCPPPLQTEGCSYRWLRGRRKPRCPRHAAAKFPGVVMAPQVSGRTKAASRWGSRRPLSTCRSPHLVPWVPTQRSQTWDRSSRVTAQGSDPDLGQARGRLGWPAPFGTPLATLMPLPPGSWVPGPHGHGLQAHHPPTHSTPATWEEQSAWPSHSALGDTHNLVNLVASEERRPQACGRETGGQ